MRTGFIVLWMLLCSITSAAAQVNVDIGLPGVNIGFSVPVYPQLVLVPGYPVYYAPQVNSNYFFYDGMYWVYAGDNWYASSWYNGPWGLVTPEAVPLFILRVPVRYYRRPPAYFHGWRSDASPRWGEHWGNAWAQQRSGWDTWNRSAMPAPAPLPTYQRQYSGTRYPHAEQQQALQSQNYRYQPHDAAVMQHYQAPRVQSTPAPSPQATQRVPQERVATPQDRVATPQDKRASKPPASVEQGAVAAPRGQHPQTGAADAQKSTTARVAPQQGGPQIQPQKQPQQTAVQHEQKATRVQHEDKGPQQGKGPAPEPQAQRQPQPAPQAVAQHQPEPQAQRQPQPAPQAVAQHQPQEPRAQGQDKGPQGKGSAQEPKQGQEKGRDKGEEQGGERK